MQQILNMLGYIVWNVKPEIFQIPETWPVIGGFAVRWYGLLFALSFILGYIMVKKFFAKENIPEKLLDELSTYMVVFTILGARLGHVFFYEPHYFLAHPLEILQIWKGGLASHGAGIGILIGIYIFARKNKLPFLWVMDRIVIPVALSGFFIRTGNLMNSEIFGYPTTLPWGFVFVNASDPALAAGPHHPTQIYEGLSYLIIFFALYRYYWKKIDTGKLYDGKIFGYFLIAVFTMRFLIEFLKEPQEYWEKSMILDMGQLLSIPFIIGGIVIVWYANRRKFAFKK